MPLHHVSDTAIWVAMYRALESERPDAHFRDPYARRMAGVRGEEIVRSMPYGESIAWSLIVRTAVMDEIILRCVAQGARTVLNLGAGLDTRAFRLALPAELHWIDVDLPDMVTYRVDCLSGEAAACHHRHIAADLSDEAVHRKLFASTRNCGGPLLVVTEGLLIYLTPECVTHLAQQLHAQPLARWWLTDLMTPLLLQTVGRRWHSQLAAAQAQFRFAPANSAQFFGPLGWQETEFRSTWDESLRLQRSVPLAWLWNTFGKASLPHAHESLRRMSGIALLERT